MAKKERPTEYRGIKTGFVIGSEECSFCKKSVNLKLNQEWVPKLISYCNGCGKRICRGEDETEAYLDRHLAKKEALSHDSQKETSPSEKAASGTDTGGSTATPVGKPANGSSGSPTGIGLF